MTSEVPGKENDQTQGDQMTSEEYREVARALAREGRWEDLAALLIERAEGATNSSSRARRLVRAAQVFEENLHDDERAYLTFLAAFQEDPTNADGVASLTRVAAKLGRFPDLLTECMAAAAEVTVPEKQAAMYVAMATWHRDQVGDAASAGLALGAALAAEPANPTALRALVDIYKARGEHGKAAARLAAAAAATREVELRVGYALDAATLYRTQLSDLDSAAEQYRRVLEAVPDHRPASEALAEIAWERKDWTTALPLLESLATKTEQGGVQAARLFQRAGWAAQMLGDNDRARANYRNAHGDDPGYLPALLRWAALALAEKWWQDVTVVVPAVLARTDAGLTAEEQAEYWEGLGHAQLERGQAEAAADAFAKALALVPDSEACREGLTRAHARLSGKGPEAARAVIERQRLLLQSASTNEEKLEILALIAQSERDQIGDVRAALETYFEMLEIKPDDPVTLHEVFEIYTNAREWARSVEVLERLVKVETGKTRARYLVAMGNILNHELKTTERAVEVYNLVLDEDPDDERTFGRIERILIAQSAWRELVRNYRRMLKRLGDSPRPEKRPQLLALWRKLGDVCRKRLHERDAALLAYEKCVQLDPEDRRYREVLAETYELLGASKLNQAVKTRESLLDGAVDFEDMAKHIRALARVFGTNQMYDRLHCTSAALVALGQALPQEQAFYERTTLPESPRGPAALAESMWQRFVQSPRQEAAVSQVLAMVSAGVAMGRANDAASLGLNPAQKVDLTADESSVGQVVKHACQLLGLALPPVYVAPDVPGQLELRIVREGHQAVPSFVLGRDLLTDRSQKELAFYVGCRLACLRADQFLLTREAVSSLGELRVIVAAAVKLVHPDFELPHTDPPSVQQYTAFLQPLIQASTLASASFAMEQIVAEPARVDLDAWAAGARQSADRAGLLVCGDLVPAVREILRRAESEEGDPEAALKDLVRWGVSSDYLDLREQLGLQAEVAQPPPGHPLGPFPMPGKPAR